MKSIMAATIIFILTSYAQAKLAVRFEMENEIEQKVTRLVHVYDPYATVDVRIDFKKVKFNLPGTDSVIENLVDVKGKGLLSEQDIQTIKIFVTYSEADLEKILGSSISDSLGLNHIKVDITWKQYDPATQENILRKDINIHIERLLKDIRGLGWFLAGGITFLVLIIFGFTKYLHGRSLTQLSQYFAGLVKALESSNQDAFPTIDVTETQKSDLLASGGDENPSQIHEIELTTLISLVSDCYWCEEDEYASWLWSHANHKQRELLIQKWPYAKEYVEHLMNITPKAKDFHYHPLYLTPLPLENISQKELALFVETDPQIFSLLPPIRRIHMQISLESKLKILESTERRNAAQWPQVTSTPRVFKQHLNIGSVQLEEEEAIFQNPNLIPENLRTFFPTLVWTRFLSGEEKKDIFERYSAHDLAKAWLGPVQLLEELEGFLPEKKRNLLKGYLRQTQPARNTPAYQSLVQEVFNKLNKKSLSA